MTLNSNSQTATKKPGLRVPWWVQAPIYAGVVGLIILLAVQMRRNGPLAAGPVGAGQPAPEFALTTFDGQAVSLADLRGKVVVVNFWASWCIPCEEEAADLESFWQAYRDRGVVLVGLDYVDTDTEARQYLERFGISYLNGPDLGTKISQAYRIQGVPETYIVDKTGTLAHVIIGPTTAADLQARVEPLLE